MSMASRVVPAQFTYNSAFAAHDGIDQRRFSQRWVGRGSRPRKNCDLCNCESTVGEGRSRSIASDKSEMPRPCSALIATLDLKPNESNSACKRLMFFMVDLVDDQDHGLLRFAQRRAQALHRSVTSLPLHRQRKAKDHSSQNASSAARRTCAVSSASPAPKIPPVSHKTKGLVPRAQTAEILSRVIPGWS